MNFYFLEPEVAGGLGDNTKMDRNTHPPIVDKLHYQFDGWLGDELLETFPCFIVTERLKEGIEGISPSGCVFDDVEVSKSQEFEDFYPNIELPKFYWLKIEGKPGIHDFGISSDNRLVVSERMFKLFKSYKFENCDISDYKEA